jgi:hypothetical protein
LHLEIEAYFCWFATTLLAGFKWSSNTWSRLCRS